MECERQRTAERLRDTFTRQLDLDPPADPPPARNFRMVLSRVEALTESPQASVVILRRDLAELFRDWQRLDALVRAREGGQC